MKKFVINCVMFYMKEKLFDKLSVLNIVVLIICLNIGIINVKIIIKIIVNVNIIDNVFVVIKECVFFML